MIVCDMRDAIKQLAIPGSTGSIGRQTLEVVRALPHRFHIVGLATDTNITLLAKQVNEFKPRFVYYSPVNNQDSEVPSALLNEDFELLSLEDMARHPEVPNLIISAFFKINTRTDQMQWRMGSSWGQVCLDGGRSPKKH